MKSKPANFEEADTGAKTETKTAPGGSPWWWIAFAFLMVIGISAAVLHGAYGVGDDDCRDYAISRGLPCTAHTEHWTGGNSCKCTWYSGNGVQGEFEYTLPGGECGMPPVDITIERPGDGGNGKGN